MLKSKKYPPGFPHTEWLLYRTGEGFGDPSPVVLIPAWEVVESPTDFIYKDKSGPGETWVIFQSWFRGYEVVPVTWPAEGWLPQSMPVTALRRYKCPPILLTTEQDELATLFDHA